MELNSFNLSDDKLTKVLDDTAEKLLGSRNIFDIRPLNDGYNEAFLDSNHGSPLLHLALNLYYSSNTHTFDGMKERMSRILRKGLTAYPFDSQGEEIEVRDGLLVLKKKNSLSDKENILYKIRASYIEDWEVNPSKLMSLYKAKSEINFFTYAYSSFFKVDRELRKHIISSLPNINFGSILLESYVYIKSITSSYPLTKSCIIELENYNKFAEKYKGVNFYKSEDSILIDSQTDIRARSGDVYEPLLYLYLAFPICCDDNATIWETINYDSLFFIISKMLEDSSNYNGRLSNNLIIDDLKKAQSILLKGSVEYSALLNDEGQGKKTIEEDILFLMSTNISNELWESTRDLPEDWLSLL
jgi:hypothetical protein